MRLISISFLAVITGLQVQGCSDTGTRPVSPPVSWTLMSAGMDHPVTALAVHNEQLIAASIERVDEQVLATLWRYDGTSWHPITPPIYGEISCMTSYAGSILVGGFFTFGGADSTRRGLAQFDGIRWQPVGTPLPRHPFGGLSVTSMTIWNGIVAFAGTIGFGNVGTWDGQEIAPLPCSVRPFALSVWQGALVAGGRPDTDVLCTEGPRLVVWEQGHWADFAGGIYQGDTPCGTPVAVSTLVVSGGELLVAGYLQHVGGVKVGNVARWDGGQWSPMGFPNGSTSCALASGDHTLLAQRSHLGTTILQWSGSAWVAVGDPFAGEVDALAVYGSDIIVAGGFPGSVARFPLDALVD
jgi:hypothetical protein